MKQKLNWLLMVVMFFSATTIVTSCKDDNDSGKTPEEQEKEAHAKDLTAMIFWQVAGQLCNGCEETDDWQAARLEANIGETSQQSEATRLVFVNNADAALANFSGLIGTELPDYTVSYNWTLDGAGSMTYRKQNDGTAWATVDVDIKQVPGLKRIVYCSPEQQGLNGYFAGTAYYRFGDVIQKKNEDGNFEYWMCVRPMFGPEKKQDMHWVSLSDLPNKNIETYVASTGDKYLMPTKLSGSYSNIHWQNAAEMLFAILHPQQWRDNLDITKNNKLEVFKDFSRSNLGYHNQYFWQRVQNAWETHNLFKELLHFDKTTLQSEMESIRFIYYGYSWHWHFGWDLTLWAQEYSGTNNNFHTFKALTKTDNVKGKPFNVHEYGKYGIHNGGYEPFPCFTYPCRYATGKQLAGFTPSEYTTLESPSNGIKDIYVYNKEYGITIGPGTVPEECNEDMIKGNGDDVGNLEYGFFTPGTIIQDSNGCRWLCYLSWLNKPELGPTGVVGGHKARFFSFDNISMSSGSVTNPNYPQANYGVFARGLVPDKEVPRLAFMLWEFATSDNQYRTEVRSLAKQYLGVNLQDFVIKRDTLFKSEKNNVGNAIIYAMNILYEPNEELKRKGTQPYMRYVMDGTHVGSNRVDLPTSQRYWMHRFFKHVSDTADQRLLDLVDLYKVYKRISNLGPVKPDQWSICKHNGTDYRDRAFTDKDCYNGNWYNWSDFSYNFSEAKWPATVTANGFTRPKFVSAYWEPIVTVRYLELDDTKKDFQDTYNGQKFTLVYEPDTNSKNYFRINTWGAFYSSIGFTWMDYIPYDMFSE